MRSEDIKAMNLRTYEPVQIRYPDEQGKLETKLGWFMRLFELPEGMTEIPNEFRDNYPIKPPFVEIAHKLDRNYCPKELARYVPEKINWLIRLYLQKHE